MIRFLLRRVILNIVSQERGIVSILKNRESFFAYRVKWGIMEKTEGGIAGMKRLGKDFFEQDPVTAARQLVGKLLVHRTDTGEIRLRITETEAYWGEADTACHAHKGRTKRTEVMYAPAGTVYIYLCYGMHWMLNLVTGQKDSPEAVLIRCCETAPGPGRLTKAMQITGSLNGSQVLSPDSELWIEDDGFSCGIRREKRVGIGYASQEDQDRLWRFCMEKSSGAQKKLYKKDSQ